MEFVCIAREPEVNSIDVLGDDANGSYEETKVSLGGLSAVVDVLMVDEGGSSNESEWLNSVVELGVEIVDLLLEFVPRGGEETGNNDEGEFDGDEV